MQNKQIIRFAIEQAKVIGAHHSKEKQHENHDRPLCG